MLHQAVITKGMILNIKKRAHILQRLKVCRVVGMYDIFFLGHNLKSSKEKRIIYFYIIEFLGSSKTRNYPIENPIRFSKLQLDHGWKNFKSNSKKIQQLMTSFYMKITNIKLKKLKRSVWFKIRLFLRIMIHDL